MTEKEMDTLIVKMQGTFATTQDHTNLEEKVDDLTETTNTVREDVSAIKTRLYQLPTKEELITAIQETYHLSKIQVEHERMKKIIHEHLHVEV